MLEAALVVVVGRPDQGLAEPRQREDRAPLRRPARTAAAFIGRRSRSSRMWVPRLGRITGTSSSSCSSSGRIRSAQTPVAFTTFAAATAKRSPRLLLLAHDAGRLPALLDQLHDRRAVHAHGPEARRLAEHRQDQPRVVGLAVVEEVRGGGVAPGRARGPAPAPRRGRSCGAGRGSSTRRPPAPPPARRGGAPAGCAATSRRTCSAPCRGARSRRAPSNAGTRKGSGFTRCGASRTISCRSTSASRTSPRSKFCR